MINTGIKRGLYNKVLKELSNETPSGVKIVQFFIDFERSNIKEINKLKRKKKATINKIIGALKQTMTAHPNFTKELLPSAAKRIYGAILMEEKETNWDKFTKFTKKIWLKLKRKQPEVKRK